MSCRFFCWGTPPDMATFPQWLWKVGSSGQAGTRSCVQGARGFSGMQPPFLHGIARKLVRISHLDTGKGRPWENSQHLFSDPARPCAEWRVCDFVVARRLQLLLHLKGMHGTLSARGAAGAAFASLMLQRGDLPLQHWRVCHNPCKWNPCFS